jgi:subfamily B ATP-binding cassette protein MsbA
MLAFLRALKALLPALTLPRWWVLSLLLFLGLLTAWSEGLSIWLLIPLVQNQVGVKGVGRMAMLFGGIPAEQRIVWIGLCILVCIFLKNTLNYGYSLLFQRVNYSISHQLRRGIVNQLLSVGQSYLDTHDSGKLLNTLGTETWRASWTFTALANAIINLCMVVTLGILLVVISWKLALVTCLFLLFMSQVIQKLTKNAKTLGSEATAANAKLSQTSVEMLHGLRLIRAFGNERHEQDRFDAASQEVSRAFWKMERTCALVQPLSEVMIAPLLLGILVVATIHNPAQLASSVTFLVLLYRLHPRVKQLDADRVALNALSASIEEIRVLLDKADKPYIRSGRRLPQTIIHGISFGNVSLRYASGTRLALSNVECTINIGETTALVGPSGAGKSSLISLICRFYDPTSGSVLVDGNPLPEIDLAWWRNQIGVVSQDVFLFNATVAENIRYGKLYASRAELLEAARRAHALEFIENLPNGFDTILGDQGIRLSGGQRQRLALARAFIRDPQILILDEATNSLDLISEEVVQDALEEFGRGRTIVMIAHRISTIERASKIIVLDGGKIVETGSTEELLQHSGLFARLYALQQPAHARAISQVVTK